MYCRECKAELPKDAHFCIECGVPVPVTGVTVRLAHAEVAGTASATVVDFPVFYVGSTVTIMYGTAVLFPGGGSALPVFYPQQQEGQH